MSNSRADLLVRQWSGRFRKDALAYKAVTGLRHRSQEIWKNTFELLQAESPEYRNSIDEEFTRESRGHCSELLKAIVAVAAGRPARTAKDRFDFARAHAAWRARHNVPLIASLHAYRLAHRTYWSLTRDLLLQHPRQDAALRSLTMLSDFWIEFFDHVGAVLAEAHAIEERLIAGQSSRTHAALVEDLLRGVQPRDPEAERLCGLYGIRPGASLAVAIARPLPAGNGATADAEIALRSLVRLLEQALPQAAFGRLIDLRNHHVTAIVCRETDAARELVEILRRHGFARRAANGAVVRFGVSRNAAEIAGLPRALEEARLAAEFASAARPLVSFPEIDLTEFLIRRADPAAFHLIPDWARQIALARDEPSRQLGRTIHAFAECNFNVKQTARQLSVHPNTVYFRLNRIEKLTGIDPRTFAGTSRLLTALRLLRIQGEPDVRP